MAQLLIVAHEPLATSLQAVARHVYPDCGVRLRALDVPPGASLEAVERLIREALAAGAASPDASDPASRGQPTETLILVDVFGATPCNAALAAADGLRTRVVAGVNVPMLWRSLCYADQPLDELVSRAVAGAAQGVIHVSVPRRQNQNSAVPSHDQVKHQHQQ
jgi:mannose PTS system EIIA component